MDEAEKQSGLEIRQLRPLSLIDVSSEDDCLIDSAFFSPPHHPFSGSLLNLLWFGLAFYEFGEILCFILLILDLEWYMRYEMQES